MTQPHQPAGTAPLPASLEAKACADVKARLVRIIATLEKIASDPKPVFDDARSVYLEIILSGHEIEACERTMRRQNWPRETPGWLC